MRKVLILFLALVLCAGILFGMALPAVNAARDQVTWTEQVIMGDRSRVEGAHVTAQNDFAWSLLWTTTATLGPDLAPETEFLFSNGTHEEESELYYSGITIGHDTGYLDLLDEDISDATKEKYADLIEVLQANYDNTPVGEETHYTLDIAEYIDYYPLQGDLDLPGANWPFWGEFNTFSPTGYQEEIAEVFSEFFKIPVQGSISIEYSIDKRTDGSTSTGASYYDYSNIYSSGVVTEDACYFTFNARQSEESVLDTSLIPGGYGIYGITYNQDENGNSVIETDSLAMVFPLDPWEEYEVMYLSNDGKRIHLMTWQGDDRMMTVIDIETMTQLQKFCIAEDCRDTIIRIRQEDGFYAFLSYQYDVPGTESITVLAENEDGTFTHAFTVTPDSPEFSVTEEMDIFSRNLNNCSMDFDGETLIIAQNALTIDENQKVYLDSYYRQLDGCDFIILAYDATGMVYAGRYQVSLSQDGSSIEPFGSVPVDVSWGPDST